ncbi:hypothetical protein BD289DRAFT_436444 [Coniella lustricola]|uniref:Uncharacterized protein n=1 Tax=Coniella lustricola TaxID=2025994 RepID=A0A2T3A558_9PEZI|nr:hypothetical protein BD289DRAFT_436444 [Coniella lustricola]
MRSTSKTLRSAKEATNSTPTTATSRSRAKSAHKDPNRPVSKSPSPSSSTSPSPSTSDSRFSAPSSMVPPLPAPALDNASLRYSYVLGRGGSEEGVLTFEPYKSLILPHWAFRTVPIATKSSRTLWAIFRSYVVRSDFVGADMARKFIKMGMTRAKRYANHKGGRKYARVEKEAAKAGGGARGQELDKWTGGTVEEVRKRREKEEASEIFKVVWRRCIADEEYLALKKKWMGEKRVFEQGKAGGG